jgi:hypothetical protein
MRTGKSLVILGLAFSAALLLSSCRAEEQGRVWDLFPGVYKGKADTQLSQAQVKSLRQRANRQSDVVSPPGGGAKAGGDVRPPDSVVLKNRADSQRGK